MGRDCSVVGEGCPAVILAEARSGERRRYYVRVSASAAYPTIAGVVRGSMIRGREWGFQVEGRLGRIAVLKPTLPELMEGFYERPTQVVYPKDSGLIALLAGVRPGSRVFEAGVGSGFLTTVLAAMACPGGEVVGVDLRRDSIEAAGKNLMLAGLEGCVRLVQGDARDSSFVSSLGVFDSVVLDLPDPWAVLEALSGSVRPSSPAVLFLPTATQLERLASRLPEGWALVGGWETMARRVHVVEGAVRPGEWEANFTGYIVVVRRVQRA